jgi:hypothetical protein
VSDFRCNYVRQIHRFYANNIKNPLVPRFFALTAGISGGITGIVSDTLKSRHARASGVRSKVPVNRCHYFKSLLIVNYSRCNPVIVLIPLIIPFRMEKRGAYRGSADGGVLEHDAVVDEADVLAGVGGLGALHAQEVQDLGTFYW